MASAAPEGFSDQISLSFTSLCNSCKSPSVTPLALRLGSKGVRSRLSQRLIKNITCDIKDF
jgi:hypothetical protein